MPSSGPLSKTVQDTLLGLFQRGTRYQTEKIVAVVAYLVLALLSAIWAFSGQNLANALGADFGQTTLSEIERDVYFLHNRSDDDWTTVRLVLNHQYLHTTPELKAGERATLSGEDFDYFYYIPRAWGRTDWEQLAEEPKPKPKAPRSLEPTFLQLRTDQGRLDQALSEGSLKAASKR